MALILVPDPICLSLERLWLFTFIERTREWLKVLVDVFRPIRRLMELLGLEA